MRLIDNWRRVLRYGWSIRLLVLAGLLSGLEVVLPYCETFIPKNLMAILSLFVTAGAFVARIIVQPKVHDDT